MKLVLYPYRTILVGNPDENLETVGHSTISYMGTSHIVWDTAVELANQFVTSSGEKKIPAIRVFRTAFPHLSLKDAKDLIEAAMWAKDYAKTPF